VLPVKLRSSSRPSHQIVAIVLSAVALAGCGSTETEEPGAQDSHANPVALDRVSNSGKPYAAALPEGKALERVSAGGFDLSGIRIMGERNGRAFYRIDAECFGTGPAMLARQPLGTIVCTPEFPSSARPILDLTVFQGSGTNGESRPTNLTVYRSEGFAADGVARVAFVDDGGAVVAESPVIDNTYSFDAVPERENLRIMAFSTTGARIFEQPQRGSAPTS
jgi:hypothetical protein